MGVLNTSVHKITYKTRGVWAMRLQGHKLKGVVVALLALGSQGALATHIDSQGAYSLGVSLYSSDGAGNFTLQVDEYMGAYGALWNGTVDNGIGSNGTGIWNLTSISPNLGFSITGASVTGPVTGTLNYLGIENAARTSFYSVPNSTWAVNFDSFGGTTDAAKYSALFSYHIANFDPYQAYSLTAAVSDCCDDVPGFPQQVYTAQTNFNLSPVPEPTDALLMGAGLLVLLARARKSKS
jgi:hypothetical protein